MDLMTFHIHTATYTLRPSRCASCASVICVDPDYIHRASTTQPSPTPHTPPTELALFFVPRRTITCERVLEEEVRRELSVSRFLPLLPHVLMPDSQPCQFFTCAFHSFQLHASMTACAPLECSACMHVSNQNWCHRGAAPQHRHTGPAVALPPAQGVAGDLSVVGEWGLELVALEDDVVSLELGGGGFKVSVCTLVANGAVAAHCWWGSAWESGVCLDGDGVGVSAGPRVSVL